MVDMNGYIHHLVLLAKRKRITRSHLVYLILGVSCLVMVQLVYQISYYQDPNRPQVSQIDKFYQGANELIDSFRNVPPPNLINYENIKQVFTTEDYSLYDGKFPLSSSLCNLKTYNDEIVEVFSQHFDTPEICEDASYKEIIQVSQSSVLDANLMKLVQILSKTSYNEMLDLPASIESTNDEFKEYVRTRFFRFGGSSVWLPEYGVHFMISRIVYSADNRKDRPRMSFVYAQLYDENWNELYNHNINIPYNDKGDLKTTKFPKFLPVEFPFTAKGHYYGPEDSRILLRKNKLGYTEPLVIFNMRRREIDLKRAMHAFLPFSNELVMFKIKDQPVLKQQKNWSAFFTVDQQDPSSKNYNKINFMYSMDPLDIMQCSLSSGSCEFLFERSTEKSITKKKSGPMRGGTSLVPLPNTAYLPIPENREIWIGFARAHIPKCGCGEDMYRPNLMLLVKDTEPVSGNFTFRIETISKFNDFHIDVPAWDLSNKGETGKCNGKSVLIPNSIAYWKIRNIKINGKKYNRDKIAAKNPQQLNDELRDLFHNNKAKNFAKKIDFDDYLGLTISGADIDNRVVHMHGLMNYIKNLPSLYDDTYDSFDYKTINNVECAVDASKQYCYEYGLANGNTYEIA